MVRKRELIDTGSDKGYVRRNDRGTSFVARHKLLLTARLPG
jgi:hypothetical protein